MKHDNDFDKMPVIVQVTFLALVVITAPIWGIPALILALLDKDENINFENGNTHESFFSELRAELEEKQ